jgi:hypothetical protein
VFGRRGIYQLPLSTTLGGLRQPIFKLKREFQLMPTIDASVNTAPRTKSAQDWVVSCNKRARANVTLWGMSKSLSTLGIRANLADIGLVSFSRGSVAWEGDHVRLVLLHKDSKGLSKAVVAQISACLRKIGCR